MPAGKAMETIHQLESIGMTSMRVQDELMQWWNTMTTV
jgi:hypothetical protein